jgi:hypothetical protein
MERPPSGRGLRVAQIRAPEEARVGCVDHAVSGGRTPSILCPSYTVPYLDVHEMIAADTKRSCRARASAVENQTGGREP